ncbi:hypothetical protein MtrunA17_Chr2g0284251 [Medicago truncatula]|uniref:Uncharacterized protein n=1 Tax=Medicago truncatula TaxID=3880 RepID=A0A072VEM8_MEDTR|nr:uncharacterized protein LOC25486003 [Medicago truncatula]KEH36635.1 hypothetical protein MTR_2g016680 [Medicago truncatula]RHN72125.1 hypothetical protein MtrunA17_Chr2g0284251 [Medicago truncatula]
MHSESVKSSQSPPAEGEKHKNLDREIREMVSAITHRVTGFHKPGSSHHLDNEDEQGTRIITLAGNNEGATLRSELDAKSGKYSSHDEAEALSTYVNSNFQAINNSIMLGGSYHANDPGVHMDISDFTEPPQNQQKAEKHGKKEKKDKKKGKEGSKSEHSD